MASSFGGGVKVDNTEDRCLNGMAQVVAILLTQISSNDWNYFTAHLVCKILFLISTTLQIINVVNEDSSEVNVRGLLMILIPI